MVDGDWDGDPGGRGISGRRVSVVVTELVPVRTKVGTRYDFIEKVVVPIYDSFEGQGQSSGSYHIVGFAGFEVTSCTNGFSGVWRTAVFGGPTSQTPTPGALKIMSVQLVK